MRRRVRRVGRGVWWRIRSVSSRGRERRGKKELEGVGVVDGDALLDVDIVGDGSWDAGVVVI